MIDQQFSNWFDNLLNFYKGLGFFTDGAFATLDRFELNEKLNAKHYREKLGLAPSDPARLLLLERQLITKDTGRVYYEDSEWVFKGSNFYAILLGRLSAISQGRFQVGEVAETWIEDQSLDHAIISLSFSFRAQPHHILLSRHSDFGQANIIVLINKLIQGSAHQFWMWHVGQDWTITCQSEDDALKMLERGHSLYEIKNYWRPICEPSVVDESYGAEWLSQVRAFYQNKDGNISWEALHWPIYTFPESIQPVEPSLYFERGLHRFKCKDFAGAWHDFACAATHGYEQIEDLLAKHDVMF